MKNPISSQTKKRGCFLFGLAVCLFGLFSAANNTKAVDLPNALLVPVPSNLKAAEVGYTTAQISWDISDISKVDQFIVYRDDVKIAALSPQHQSYSDEELQQNKSYTYKVSSYNGSLGYSLLSAPLTITTEFDNTPPTKPENATARAISRTAIQLNWNTSQDNAGVAYYRIYSGYTLIATTTHTYYEINGLNPDTEYRYNVRAIDMSGLPSPVSDSAYARTKLDDTPPVVSIDYPLWAGAVSGNTITARVTASDESGIRSVTFELGRFKTGNFATKVVNSAPFVATFDATGLADDSYDIQANALDNNGNQGHATVTFNLRNGAGSLGFTDVWVTNITSSSAVINWNTNINSTSTVNFATSGSKVTLGINDATLSQQHSRTLSNLLPDTTYQYQIISYNGSKSAKTGTNLGLTFKTLAKGAEANPPAQNQPQNQQQNQNQNGAISPAMHPNGTLVLDGTTVYLIKNNQRYGFRDPEEYKSHGYNFNQAVAASQNDKVLPLAGEVIKALEGSLVLDKSDGKTVYMVGTNGTKRGFASEAVFKNLGYKFYGLLAVDMSDYTPGPAIDSGSAAHPDGALVLDGKTVWWVRGNNRQGFESAEVFNTYGFSFSKIVPANDADLSLPEGPLVKFRDGTLVLDGANYYLISDGKKLKFGSENVLAGRGYKTTNRIQASLQSYESGPDLQ